MRARAHLKHVIGVASQLQLITLNDITYGIKQHEKTQ